MTLDDVYGSDQDRFPLEQEEWDADDSALRWDYAEVQHLAEELGAARYTLA